MNDKVVYLAFKNEKLQDEFVSFTACVECRNKTFTLHPSIDEQEYPMLRCAACGSNIGRIGWSGAQG